MPMTHCHTDIDAKVQETVNKFKLSKRTAKSLIFHVLTDPAFQHILRNPAADVRT